MEEAWTDGSQREKGSLQEVSCGFLVSAMTGKREKMRSIHLYRTLFPLSFSFFVRLEGGIESCLSPLGIPPRSDRRAAPLGRLAQGMNRRSGEGKKSPFFFHGP